MCSTDRDMSVKQTKCLADCVMLVEELIWGEASDHKAHRVLQTKEVGLSFSVKLELKGSPDEEASTGLKCKIDLHSFSVKLWSSLFKTDI